MSDDIEAAGAAVTAGLAAKALEGGAGPHKHGQTGPCLNCGAPLGGAYCQACGQPVHISRTLHDVWHDFAHGVLHFDTKAWTTLPLLAFRPGSLTRRYIHGQRARFISPMALFLFTVFLMFFVFALMGDGRSSAPVALTPAQQTEEMAMIARAESRLAVALAEAEAAGDPEKISQVRTAQRFLERAREGGQLPPGMTILETDDGVRVSYSLGAGGGLEPIFDEIRAAQAEGRIRVNTGNPTWDKKITAKLADPEFAWYKIQNTAYKFSFLLVPLSVPLVWLMFAWKRGVTLFDHSVFVLYSLSFMTLLLIAFVLINQFNNPFTDAIVLGMGLSVPLHMYFQLKGGYALGWFSALWRTVYLMVAAVIALSVFIILILLMGLLG